MTKLKTLSEIEQELFSRAPENKIDPTTVRVQHVLARLGNPQNKFSAIHITGTNGKTSTSYLIEQKLLNSGKKVGKFTSPHVLSVNERIQINAENISDRSFIELYSKTIAVVNSYEERFVSREVLNGEETDFGKLSFFEVLVVMAYQYFAEKHIEVGVIEVGLGGRFDATNVLENKIVAVIMPIGIDHTQYLGETIEEIANEKTGIIMPGVSVFVADQKKTVLNIIKQRAQKLNAPVIVVKKVGETYLEQNEHMADAVADFVLEKLVSETKQQEISIKQRKITKTLPQNLPLGRLQTFSERSQTEPQIILDVAHNAHGAKALKQAFLQQDAQKKGRNVAVVAQMKDKDNSAYLQVLSEFVDVIVVAENSSERSATAHELFQIAEELKKNRMLNNASVVISEQTDVISAFNEAKAFTKTEDTILITGSVITVSDFLKSAHATLHA